MTPPQDLVAAARRSLESRYGLALEGLSQEQIGAAVSGAEGAPVPDPADPRWLERVVDRLPIDESWLFRDDDLWTWLGERAGPELLERARSCGRPLRILSLGCSTGQEVFSLGILFQGLAERVGLSASEAVQAVSILGLDSSPARVEVARSGCVNAWSVQRCRPDWLRGRVVLEDPATGRHRVDMAVRNLCRFEVGNLLSLAAAGNAALGGFDLVLCRHVLIYFRAAEAERIAAALAAGLDPGALLVVATAEAHLLGASGRAEPAGHVGAARMAPAGGAPSIAPAARPGRSRASARRFRAGGPRARSRAAPRAAGDAPGADPVAGHVSAALEHARAGRAEDAVRAARAALFHDPRHLLSRLVLGRHLAAVDAPRGRQVLRELLATASRLPADGAVPSADGLSVGQLVAAVRLLLERAEGA